MNILLTSLLVLVAIVVIADARERSPDDHAIAYGKQWCGVYFKAAEKAIQKNPKDANEQPRARKVAKEMCAETMTTYLKVKDFKKPGESDKQAVDRIVTQLAA